MDRFELNWPGADVSFYTDGWRCRIVWRQKGRRHGAAGMGGTIENNQQCVKRAAESLEGAPYFLSALKARGYDRLADQIGSLAVEEAMTARPPVRSDRRTDVENRSAPKRVERAEVPVKQAEVPVKQAEVPQPQASTEAEWLKALEGDDAFELAKDKRAKVWHELGALTRTGEVLLLKTPAAKGRGEWVLKRNWPEEAGRKPDFVVASAFKGIACHLVDAGMGAEGVEQLLSALAKTSHSELEAAAAAWRAAGRTH